MIIYFEKSRSKERYYDDFGISEERYKTIEEYLKNVRFGMVIERSQGNDNGKEKKYIHYIANHI